MKPITRLTLAKCIAPQYVFGVLLALLASIPVMAQTERAKLIVIAKDAQGKAVTGAIVTLVKVDTRKARTLTTGKEGTATFVGLAPGAYKVSAKADGYPPSPTKSVSLNVGATLRVKLRLEAGITSKDIEVRYVIIAPHGVTSTDRNDLLILPNLNNDLTPLLQVVPGAVATGTAALGRVIIDGKGAEQQVARLDGIDATPVVELPSDDRELGVVETFQKQSVTAIDQEKTSVISKAFSPIYGPGVGSITESVTKRGVKDFKFQFYNLMRNDALDARNYFDYEGKNAIRRNQFGGEFAGPLIGKKSFFFVGYEGIRGRTERNLYEAVPADAACQCATGRLAPFLAGYLPPGTTIVPGASLDHDFVVARRRARSTSNANAFDARLDILRFANSNPTQPGEDGLVFRVIRQTGKVFLPDGVTGRQQFQRLTFMNALAKARWKSNNFINEFKAGLNLSRGVLDVEGAPSTVSGLGASLITVDGTVDTMGLSPGFETVPVATLGGQVKGIGSGFGLNPHSLIASYNLTYMTGGLSHTMNFGSEARFTRLRFDRGGGLTYAFPNTTALRAGTPAQVTFVSDLSGAGPFSVEITGPRRAAQDYYAGYFQDEWEMKTPGTSAAAHKFITLTYGFRFDYFGVVRAEDDRAVVVDPKTGSLLPPGAAFYKTRKGNFQPRVGVAYELPFSAGLLANTAIRAGFGFYSGVPRIGDLLLPIESDRFSTGVTGASFPASAGELARNFLAHPETRQFQPLAFSRDYTTPERAYKWEAALVRHLRAFGNLTLSYFGNVGRNLPLAGIANPIIRVETNPDPTQPALVQRQFDIVRDGLIFKPFGEFLYRTSGGRSAYNALSVSLERDDIDWLDLKWARFSTLKIQYTLSRNVGNASGAVASNPSIFNSDYGYNAADARHSFSLNAVYKPWLALSPDPRNPIYKAWDFLRGWVASTTVSARSGLPLIVRLERPDVVYTDANGAVFSTPAAGRSALLNTPGGGATGNARGPDLIAGMNPYLHDGIKLLNPAAFAIPAPGRFGNLRRGYLRGPNLFQLNLALTRNFLDKEKSKGVTVEFKAECFNVFNHANFANPTALLPDRLGIDAAANRIQPGAPFTVDAAKSFGVFSAADPGRRIQFSLNFKFNEGF